MKNSNAPAILQHMHVIVAPDKQDTVRIFSNVPIPDEPFDLLVLLRSGQLTIVRNYYVDLPESMPEAAQQVAVVEPVMRQAAAEPRHPFADNRPFLVACSGTRSCHLAHLAAGRSARQSARSLRAGSTG